MRKYVLSLLVLIAAASTLVVASIAVADDDGGNSSARLDGYFEVPAVSTTGEGRLRLRIDSRAREIAWNLSWSDLEVGATQAHIHFGQKDVNGGISVFFCTNLGNAPASPPNPPTAACPTGRSGELSGVFTPAHVAGPAAQGIEPGSFDELVAAIRAGVTYANIHSVRWPGGEIRGQIGRGGGGGNDD